MSYCPRISVEGLNKSQKTSVILVCVLSKLQTMYLLNTKLQHHYRLVNLVQLYVLNNIVITEITDTAAAVSVQYNSCEVCYYM